MRRAWKSKKILSLILALVLLAGTITGAVYANEDGEEPEATASEVEVSEAAEADPEPEAAAEAEAEAQPEASAEPSAEPTMSTAEAEEGETTTYANSVSGMLWLDMFDDTDNSIYAGDGVRQSEEEPLAGYTVELFKADDTSTAVQTATTDADGTYEFTGLEPGDYVVGVKTGTIGETEYLLPLFWLDGKSGDNRFVATLDEDADAYIYAYTDSITVGEDTAVTDVDAGMRTVPKAQPMSVTWTVNGGSFVGAVYTDLTTAITDINADSGTTYTVTGGGGTESYPTVLSINAGKDVSIDGGGAVITQTGASVRHFQMNGSLTLENITLDGGGIGGGVYVGGATLTMNASAVIQNCLNAGGGAVEIDSGGTMTMNDGKIIGNTATTGDGGGVYVNGSGSTFDMLGGEISGNTATVGGGVTVYGGGAMTMDTGAKISGNTSSTAGGGVAVTDSGSTFDMIGGEISGNTAAIGGGVYVVGGAVMTMAGAAKIIGNTAVSNGGGVYVEGSGGTLFDMQGGEISGNTATTSGGGVAVLYGAAMTMDNAAKISGNTATTSGGGVFVFGAGSTFDMQDGEISDVGGTGNTATTGGGVYVVNGGAMTMAGAAKISGNTAGGNEGGGVFVTGSGSTFDMQGGEISGNTATLNGGGVSVLLGAAMTMDNAAKISGNTASYGGGVCVNVSGSTFDMNDGEISGNTATSGGGGVCVGSGSTFDMNGGEISGANTATDGGGVSVYSGATMTMDNAAQISGNTATGYGGGVYVVNGGAMTMTGAAKIIGNTATVAYGGGVCVDGSGSTFDMLGGEISGGNTSARGGGVYVNGGAMTMDNGAKISGNTAPIGGGGGVYVEYGTFDMLGGEISGNTAPIGGGGGGVCVTGGGAMTMDTGAKISGNTASYSGGGVLMMMSGTFDMLGGEISGNTTAGNGGGVSVQWGAAMTMDNAAKISGNTATGNGGGVYVDGSTFDMLGGEISGGNTAGYGGGVAVFSNAAMTMAGAAKINGNTADYGGGVYVANTSSVTITNGIIDSNTATAGDGGGIYLLTTSDTLTMTAGSITNNAAPGGFGGGIYTPDTTTYANITTGSAVVFSGNTANMEIAPPSNASLLTNIGFASQSSITYSHPLNNYDINRSVYIVTEKYVDKTGADVAPSTTATVTPGNTYDVPSTLPTVATMQTHGYQIDTSASPAFNPGGTITVPVPAGGTALTTPAGDITVYYVYVSSVVSVSVPTGMDFYVDETTALGVESGPIGGGGGDYYEFENNSDLPVYIDLTSMTVNSATANLDVVDDVTTTTSIADDILHLNLLKATTGNSNLPVGTPNGFTGSDVNNVMPDAVGSYGASVSGTYGTGVARLGVLDGTFVQQSTPTDTKGYTTLSGTYDGAVTTTAKTANLTFTFTYDLAP